MQKHRFFGKSCLFPPRMKVGPSRSLGRWILLVASFALAAGGARAQIVWDGTTSLAATSLGSNTVSGAATLSITTSNNHDFNGTAIVNNGTVNWQAGQLRSGTAGSFTNATGEIGRAHV
jgi:hypothetical protein